jgi:hypothetical protein
LAARSSGSVTEKVLGSGELDVVIPVLSVVEMFEVVAMDAGYSGIKRRTTGISPYSATQR